MPIVRAGSQLIYFAHVPKCAGSAVESYLRDRFGPIAFRDNRYMTRAPAQRWSRTSPQHVDAATLRQFFPKHFFDASFAVVRHPVSRVVSAWHFQLEVEKRVPQGVSFSEWLEDLADRHEVDPFVFDNHTRPMTELVPDNAEIFRLEEGLDGIVDWLDGIVGNADGPRTIGQSNIRGAHGGAKSAKVEPDPVDLETIRRLYAADFERFGYAPDRTADLLPKPERPAGTPGASATGRTAEQFLGRLKNRLIR